MKMRALATCVAFLAVLNLSACVESRHDEVGYRYEHGDRVAPDGRRDVGWCRAHASDEHCQTAIAESP